MVKKNKQTVTMEELATMVQAGFSDMDRRLVEVHDELSGLRGQVNGINRRLDAMADNHGLRLKRLEKHAGLAPRH